MNVCVFFVQNGPKDLLLLLLIFFFFDTHCFNLAGFFHGNLWITLFI